MGVLLYLQFGVLLRLYQQVRKGIRFITKEKCKVYVCSGRGVGGDKVIYMKTLNIVPGM